jgi:transcriptional regulator with AAA-type ATPase domain/tetratricopeptide (TPR) repeat protein
MKGLDTLIGSSPPMRALHAQMQRLLARPGPGGRLPPLLVLGETGTGKGLVVRILHQASARRDGPLIDVNCAAIPDTLVEAELFGHERGAFTDARQAKPGLFQAAHGGVLFLDEIGSLPLATQAKLLTAIERREVRRLGGTRVEPVDAWIFSATNEDLATSVARREFRLDLYHRISAITLEVPPLRERGGDVLLLAHHFLERISADYGLPTRQLTTAAEEALMAHSWPGNVRELINLLERAVLLADTEKIVRELLDLPPAPGRRREPGTAPSAELGRETVQAALEASGWNLSRAAARLGVPRNTLRYRIERFGLRPRGVASAEVPAAIRPVALLSAAPAPLAAPDAAPARLRWERRWITGLLIRVESPSSSGSFLIPALLDDVVRKVESFGGHLEELHPHGFTALFGHEPMEDAPSRAALTAQAIQKAVAGARDPDGGRATLTAALHTTESVIARGMPAGGMDLEDRRRLRDTLAQLAAGPEGGVVASADAARFLERRFALAPLPGHAQVTYRLLGPSPSGFDVGGRARSAFVGRTREMAQLDDLLAEVEQARGQLVGVVGEPGSGKSRLLHEFRQGVGHERVTYLEGRCTPHGTHVPYLPIIQLLRQAFAFAEADDPAIIATRIHEGVESLGLPGAGVVPYVLHLLGVRDGADDETARLSPASARDRALEALRQVTIAASQQRTVIIAIEDLQWMDATSAESLMALAESVAACRILMVATYRQGYQPPWLGKSYATQLVLRRLSPADSSKIVQSIAPAGALAGPVADALVAKADGIPFFLEELVRTMSDGPGDSALAGIPGTIQGVVTARLDRLSPTERSLLEAAGVLGREGALSVLRAVSGLADADFAAALTNLRSAEFLRETRVVPSPEYAFTHALTQEVAYRALSTERRRALHREAAAAIEKLSPRTAARMPEVLAHHLTEAGMAAPAIGCWYQAGRLAMQRWANAEAVVHFTSGLSLLRAQPDKADRAAQEVAMLLALVAALSATRGYAAVEVEEALARARALVEELGTAPQTFLLRWNLWRFYVSRAEYRTAEDLALQLFAAAERQGDEAAILNTCFAVGVTKFYLGEFGSARDHLTRALGLYRGRPSQQEILTYGQDMGIAGRGFLAWTLAVTGDLEGAAREAETALRDARDLDHPFSLALVILASAEAHQLRRDANIVEALGRELLDLSREHSFRFFTAFGLMFTGWARAAAGDPRDGLAMMQQGADLFRSAGQRAGLAHRAHLAEILIAQGRLGEGLAVVRDALDQSAATGEGAFVAELRRLCGEALRAQGRPGDAEHCLREALDTAVRQGAWLFALRAAGDLIRLGAARGAPPAADLDALADVVSHFSPSLDSIDLRAARAFLVEANHR